jgi:pyrroline-5-carboxylate reductase
VIIAVKPKDVPQLLGEIRPHLRGDKLLLSIAAGITTSRIEKAADMKIPVVRAMPNMAASIGESMTSLTAGRYAGRAHIRMARDIFSTIGEVVEVGENMVDAVTAVSGSGPAYFFYLVEILMEVAKELGLKRGVAEKLVLKTALASSRLLHLLGERPEVLRKKVTSKGGTTEAAFRVLESGGVKEIIKRAVRAAHGRSKELSES